VLVDVQGRSGRSRRKRILRDVDWSGRPQSMAVCAKTQDPLIDCVRRNDTSDASTTISSALTSANITGRRMTGHRTGSRRMYARSVNVLAGGLADNARPCVPKWRCRASAIRRGSAERPTNNSPRPSAESGLDRMNRYAVVLDASRDGASIDVLLHETEDRRSAAGPAPALPSTVATTTATTATVGGPSGESADANARGRRAGAAGQASRAGGLCALPALCRPSQPS
jgi:hypothetical protein